ncbi:MAG: c-type cytochrome biogenesis protein CcmI [Gammaproteobacteria bacterium]|nr:c-type cytochrome biogenesis protein CcmI [Gammaproteobacteria bacterium]NKB62810.1 c-type cytochrome biogenesis protein CcmI [Gammaproteobacteria bacterium]
MTVFLIVVLGITLGAIATLLKPLFSLMETRASENEAQRETENIQIARDRLAEIAQMEASSDDYKRAQQELETALLDDLHQAKLKKPQSVLALPKVWSILILLFVPASAIGIYTLIGNPEFIDQEIGNTSSAPAEQDIGKLLIQLEQKIAANPSNPDGWSLAANTYMMMGNFSKAREAYEALANLVGDDSDVLTAWSDAIIMDSGNSYVPEAQKNINRALELNPDNINALWIAGLGNQSLGDHERAIRHLKKLHPLMDGDPEAQQQIQTVLADSLGQRNQTSSASVNKNESKTVDESAANTSNSELAGNDEVSNSGLQIRLSLASDFSKELLATDTIFVVAKATQGSPIPLAVNRLSGKVTLPMEVLLDASMAMLPTHKISNFEEVKVSARISKSGEAIRQLGDLISDEVVSKVGSSGETIELEIRHRVE